MVPIQHTFSLEGVPNSDSAERAAQARGHGPRLNPLFTRFGDLLTSDVGGDSTHA